MLALVALNEFPLVAVLVLGFLAYGTAKVFQSDGPGVALRKWLEPRGWTKAWVDQASGVVHDDLPDGKFGYQERFTPRRRERHIGSFAVSSPWPSLVRFVYKLTECPYCTGFHTAWIAWSLAYGWHPLTLKWWVGVFAVRGVQAFMVAVER